MPHPPIPIRRPITRLPSLIFIRTYVSPKRIRQKANYRETWNAHLRKQGKTIPKRQGPGPDRDYAAAVRALESLRSNSAAKALFKDPFSQDGDETTAGGLKRDPNEDAIPEMLKWLERAGYSAKDLASMRHIHVAGTKGKGSVADYATSLLLEAPRHIMTPPSEIGTYVSPHLLSHTERILISGIPVTETTFARWFWHLWERFTVAAIHEGMPESQAEGPDSKPFYFRYMTILAWHIFKQSGVKHVVMECGIGGEYDATNVLPKEAVSTSVITSLGLDHTNMLGDTVESIAWHKSGVFKEGGTAVVARDEREEVREVLRTRAAEKGVKLLEIDNRDVEKWEGASADDDLIAKKNQALAVAAVKNHHKKLFGTPMGENALQDVPRWMTNAMRTRRSPGIRRTITKGDTQKIHWFLDGAHTKESLDGVAAWFMKHLEDDEDALLIFNQTDRNTKEALQELLDTCRRLAPGRERVFDRVFVYDDVDWTEFCERHPQVTVVKGPLGALGRVESYAVDYAGRLIQWAKERVKLDANPVDSWVEEPGANKPGNDPAPQSSPGLEAKPAGETGKDVKVLVTGSFHLVGAILTEFAADEFRGTPGKGFGTFKRG